MNHQPLFRVRSWTMVCTARFDLYYIFAGHKKNLLVATVHRLVWVHQHIILHFLSMLVLGKSTSGSTQCDNDAMISP